MAICKNCKKNVGCSCNMKNGMCSSCFAQEEELKKIKNAETKTK